MPLGPRPLFRGRPSARLLIVSQAPGSRAHRSGLSFDDPSGQRLRDWLGIEHAAFYDESRVAIVPVGLCYPGRSGAGDRPPLPECAPLWHPRLLPHFAAVRLTLLVGSYAIRRCLPQCARQPAGAVLARWREFLPGLFVLPHPSWRGALWERQNPWFAAEMLPMLREAVAQALR
ncbi:MAG TPA: uracil-DNA glycosylase family protein [Stellaceae bacterium]|nr:uracil-DNA glycosylase family protein [Stellaceae bacterium]